MDPRTFAPHGLALGVARFILLMVATAGFMAMHGMAATDQAGLHHNPTSMSATSAPHGVAAVIDGRPA